MSAEMQLQHYETQHKKFLPLYKEWEREFQQWQDQIQAYPHKDQLHECEEQWRMWQGQMKATQNHLQEKVKSLRTMNSQYVGGTTVTPQFPSYSQATQGGLPIMPSTLPSTTLSMTSTGFSSGPHVSNISGPKECGPQSTQITDTSRPAAFSSSAAFPFKLAESSATSHTAEVTRPALLPTPTSPPYTYKATEPPAASQPIEATRPALLPTPASSSFPYKMTDSSATSQATETGRPALLPTPSVGSFSFKMTDSPTTSHGIEAARPALLPTPAPFSYKPSDSSTTMPYQSNVTSSANSSDPGSSCIPMGKQPMPFGSVSSELGSVEVKPPCTVSSSSAATTTATTTYQNKPVRLAGFPESPRGPCFDSPRGPR